MTRQMSDAELDAILGALNDEIKEVVDETTDVEAGREQVMRAARPLQAQPWRPASSGPKELTSGRTTPSPCPHDLNSEYMDNVSALLPVLSRLSCLEGSIDHWLNIRMITNSCQVSQTHADPPTSLNRDRVRSMLARMRRELAERSMDKQTALELIDQLDQELHTEPRPLVWGPSLVSMSPCEEIRSTLARLRRDVDHMYDDGDNLVTC
ncbi:hypothetical protein [Nonomuraea sp. NPDC049400]|uniref:hypothetical protein n=1 Tax=Nonomuraea sp. NPDC049400 TaxID=3364352 RepID=UPI0037BB1283